MLVAIIGYIQFLLCKKCIDNGFEIINIISTKIIFIKNIKINDVESSLLLFLSSSLIILDIATGKPKDARLINKIKVGSIIIYTPNASVLRYLVNIILYSIPSILVKIPPIINIIVDLINFSFILYFIT